MIQWQRGDRVYIHYAAKKLPVVVVAQDSLGVVIVAASLRCGGPKNVAVKLRKGGAVIVPYGNVRKHKEGKK